MKIDTLFTLDPEKVLTINKKPRTYGQVQGLDSLVDISRTSRT